MKSKLIIYGFMALLLSACNDGRVNNDLIDKESGIMENGPEKAKTEQEMSANEDTNKYQNIESNLIINDSKVGLFKIGDPIAHIKALTKNKIKKEIQTRMTDEGPAEEPGYVLSEKGKKMLIFMLEYDYNNGNYIDTVGEIIVISEKYKTSKGIGVNSTIDEFIQQYPKYKIWYSYISGRFVIQSNEINALFLLSEGDFIGEMYETGEVTELNRSNFKKGAKIIKIIVFEEYDE